MVFIVLLLIILNAVYYGYLIKNWNNLSSDGCAGQSALGILLQ